MNPDSETTTKPAWVQLYEARRPTSLIRTRPRGRPPRVAPRKATVFHLTDGERREINSWQEQLSPLLGRKVSLGETAGILARICSARLPTIDQKGVIDSFADLVKFMVGEEGL